MRWLVINVAGLVILGVAASGLILAQKESTPIATTASTAYSASVSPEVSALSTRAPVSQIAQATASEASPLISQANVDAQSGSPITRITQAPLTAPIAPSLKDAESKHYLQGYGQRDHAIEGRFHGVGT